MTTLRPLNDLDAARFERPDILKKLTAASRGLAELKGVASTIPNQCWRRVKTDHLCRLKIDQAFSGVAYSVTVDKSKRWRWF
jgi:hypothetical protein